MVFGQDVGPLKIEHEIEPSTVVVLAAGIFVAIVLGFMLGTAITKR